MDWLQTLLDNSSTSRSYGILTRTADRTITLSACNKYSGHRIYRKRH